MISGPLVKLKALIFPKAALFNYVSFANRKNCIVTLNKEEIVKNDMHSL